MGTYASNVIPSMASSLFLVIFSRKNTICSQTIRSKLLSKGHKGLQKYPACCWYAQHQSTFANTHLPPGSYAKRRGKKKTTTDIIQVKDMSISESHAKIKRVTNRSFEQTLSALSPSLVNTNSNASTDKVMDFSKENLYSNKESLHEQLKSAYFALENVNVQNRFTPNELKQAHSQLIQLIASLEKTKGNLVLSVGDMKNIKQSAVDDITITLEQPFLKDIFYPKDDDAVRWSGNHKYDGTIIDPHTYNTIECDNSFENVDTTTNMKMQQGENIGLDGINNMPSALSGFASVALEIPPVIKDDKVTKKRKKKEKVISTKVKKTAKSKKKAKLTEETQVMNEAEQDLDDYEHSHITNQLGHYYPMEEEIEIISTKSN